jgi:DNA-directed RNA polymerase specialized sigma24 family protein
MTISEDILRVWMQDAKKYLHRYWDHPHYDDIVASAYLNMWQAITRADECEVKDLKGYTMRAAWNGAQSFLGSAKNEHRTFDIFKRKETTPTIYLEDVIAGRSPDHLPRNGVEPDFAPKLIEWLAAQEELERKPAALQAALILCCLEGLTREEARLQLGLPRWRIDRLLQRVPFAAIPYAHSGGCNRRQPGCRDVRGQFVTGGGRVK